MKDTFDTESRKRIIICSPLKRIIPKLMRRLDDGPFRWAYLGEDVSRAIAMEKQLGDRGQRLEIAEELQKVAQSLRQPYIDYIGQLSLKNNSTLWWVSSLSEKNPWVSKTFLYACYIRLVQNIITANGQKTLVFLVENKALRTCLLKNTSSFRQYEAHPLEPYTALESIRKTLGVVLSKCHFILRSTYRLLLARYYRLNQITRSKLHQGKGFVLLHSWIDQRAFAANGKHQDPYFNGLAQHMRNKGERVIIVPYISSIVSYHQTLKRMVASGETFLAPESFLKISDVWRVLVKTLMNAPAKRAYPLFEGIEISEIIIDDLRRDWAGTGTASSLLLYEAVKRWKKAGIPVKAFISTYENHVWERAYGMALRKFYPSAKITSFQHATAPKMLLNFFFSREELPVLPFPDRVITSGKYTEKLFKESGYDPEKVICGGAISYKNLLNKEKTALRREVSKPVILVTPSIDKNETIELVWKVLKAFGQINEYKIIFKFHPACPYQSISKDLGILPEHFIVSDKAVTELLQESNLLLYTSSATSIEALSLGVPVLHIKSDFIIDRDNLTDFPSRIRQSAKNAEDIVRMTEEILKTDKNVLSEQRRLWKETVSEIFGPVNEGVLDLFL